MTPRELELRDEILQVLFWLQGEKLGEEASARELALWIAAEADELEPVAAAMVADGYLLPAAGERYRLSELGLAEGGRRFTESFAEAGLGGQGHGACAPGCDCSLHGPEHCSHSRGHEHEHEHGNGHGHEHPGGGGPAT